MVDKRKRMKIEMRIIKMGVGLIKFIIEKKNEWREREYNKKGKKKDKNYWNKKRSLKGKKRSYRSRKKKKKEKGKS